MGGLTPEWTIVLDDGTYYTIHSIIGKIQRSTAAMAIANDFPADRFVVQIQYANRHKRIKIVFTKYAFRDTWVYFSEHLVSMLGFELNKYYWFKDANDDKEIYAERPVLLSAGTGNVYVYFDLLKHVMVGDIKAPLLRTVNRKTDVLRLEDIVEHTAFNPIQYVPLQKKSFDMIDILLATDHGEPLPFVPGKAIVVLEFRRTVHPYLLLYRDARLSTVGQSQSDTIKRKTWNREEKCQLYKDYYRNQAGSVGAMPVFVGRRYQCGHGLAQTIGSLFKCFVMPIIVPAVKCIGKQILGNVAKTGMEVAGDVIGRRNIRR